MLSGPLNKEVHHGVNILSDQLGGEIRALNIKADHIHVITTVAPKLSISPLMGTLKARTALGVIKQCPYRKKKPYWGNHFWAKGSCVDTLGLNPEMIGNYVEYQEAKQREEEQRSFRF